jgi:hypothetical protein
MPYPFGSDGNPVDPTSHFCAGGQNNLYGPGADGPQWSGDFQGSGDAVAGEVPCYQQVESMAFRAWNRGLAVTAPVSDVGNVGPYSGNNPFAVWLFNGTTWFPDPTFPGSATCPGNTILWAGKLDYWLIGRSQILCRFDGVNLAWEPLSLPASTVAREPLNFIGQPTGRINAGTCFAWNNCWFFGTDGIEVHWDGQQLSDASGALGNSPWLQGDFTAAASTTAASGAEIGVAVNGGQRSTGTGTSSLPANNGLPAPQVFGSQGDAWSPLSLPADSTASFTPGTDLTDVAIDASGDTWIAAAKAPQPGTPPALIELNPNGGTDCSGAIPTDAGTYQWTALSVAPDGTMYAGGTRGISTPQWQPEVQSTDTEPVIVHGTIADGVCGGFSTGTEFREGDPLGVNPVPVPADEEASIAALAAPANNDVWAAVGAGQWQYTNSQNLQVGGVQRPHLYQFTDGQVPDAPAGDDNETRPSLFTLGPPQYSFTPPETVVVGQTQTITTTRRPRSKHVKLPAPIYAIHTQLSRSPHGAYVLHLLFRVRRPVTVGLEVLHGHKVVARTGLKHFTGQTGVLSVRLNRKAWPTRLKLVSPPPHKQ